MNLLIKLPSRERPTVLLRAARLYSDLCADKARTQLLVSLDDDDPTVDATLLKLLRTLPLVTTIAMGPRTSKIAAVNRDLPGAWPWQILLVASDDQWPLVRGYDDIIRADMDHHWPAGDGCLWYSDGHQDRVCTQCVMDRSYYARDGFVYHPEYLSYFADDEFTLRAQERGRMRKSTLCLIRHEHPFWRGQVQEDGLYAYNRRYKEQDRQLFGMRKAAGWP